MQITPEIILVMESLRTLVSAEDAAYFSFNINVDAAGTSYHISTNGTDGSSKSASERIPNIVINPNPGA